MKLLNVRLSEEDVARVKALRDDGVEISALVRDAIRAEHARRQAEGHAPEEVDEILERIYRTYPAPPNLPSRKLNIHDRRAFARAVGEHIRAETRKP